MKQLWAATKYMRADVFNGYSFKPDAVILAHQLALRHNFSVLPVTSLFKYFRTCTKIITFAVFARHTEIYIPS